MGTGYYVKCSEDCNNPADCIDCVSFERMVDRLGAYEDTGFEPDDIPLIDPVKWGHAAAQAKVEGVNRLYIEQYGIPETRLHEIVEAERQGRLVVLEERKTEPLTAQELRNMDGPVWCACKPIEGGDGYWCLCKNGLIITPAGTCYDIEEIPHWVFRKGE